MPNFYTYPAEISNELKVRGYDVDVFDEAPRKILFLVINNISKWTKTKILYNLFCLFLYCKIKSKHEKYDFMLVIRGNILNNSFIRRIRCNLMNDSSKLVFYSWDSFKYLEHRGSLGDEFDRKYTFDSEDVKSDNTWQLLPLFYTSKFDNQASHEDKNEDTDLCCVAGFNLYRYKTLKKIEKANPGLKLLIRLYINKDLFNYKLKAEKEYSTLDMSWIYFDQLSSEEVACLNLRSKAVLDVTDIYQSGLSMRTIEAIGLKKKLVTNNLHVKEYDFYASGNVFLFDTDCKINQEWLNSSYVNDSSMREKYSLKSWVKTLLSD